MKKALIIVVAVLAVGGGVLVYRDLAKPPARPGAAAPVTDRTTGSETPAAPAEPKPASRVAYFRNPSTGENQRWRFGADGQVPAMEPVQAAEAGWNALAYAERGWGDEDAIIWRNATSLELRLWRVGADGAPAAAEVIPYIGTEWQIAALADADADGDADLVWVDGNGGVAVWTLDAGKVVAKASVGASDAGLVLSLAGDFDADGRVELIWRSEDGGRATRWTLQGTSPATVQNMDAAGPDWKIVGAGDVDGVPGEEVLWQGPAGRLLGWSGADPARPVAISRPAADGWAFIGAADVDGDGRNDLVWRQIAGTQVGAWRLGENGAVSDLELPPLDQAWKVVPRALSAQ